MLSATVIPWIAYLIALVAASVPVYYLLSYYKNASKAKPLATAAATLTIMCGAAVVLLLPVDAYVVSHLSDLTDSDTMDEAQKLDAVALRTSFVQYGYLGLTSLMLLLLTVLVPCATFGSRDEPFEGFDLRRQESDPATVSVKWTLLFWVLLGGLVAAVAVLRPYETVAQLAETFDWAELRWGKSLEWGEAEPIRSVPQVANLVLACLSVLGFAGWCFYLPLGLARLPVHTLKGNAALARAWRSLEEAEATGRNNGYILEKDSRGGALSRRERRDLEALQRSRGDISGRRANLQSSYTALTTLFAKAAAARIACGVLLLLLSLAIVASVGVTLGDTAANGERPFLRYGGSLLAPTFADYNVLNQALENGCAVEFVDFAVVVVLLVYLLACTLYGISTAGRCGVKLKPKRTKPLSLLASATIFSTMALALLMEAPGLAPSYMLFGCQRTDTDSNCLVTTSLTSPTSCIMTQAATISLSVRLGVVAAGQVLFVAQAGFVLVFLVGCVEACVTVQASTDDFVERDEFSFE